MKTTNHSSLDSRMYTEHSMRGKNSNMRLIHANTAVYTLTYGGGRPLCQGLRP